MPKFKVDYTLSGSIVVDADNSVEAARKINGAYKRQVTDEQVIAGIEGYDPKSKKMYTIEDAVHIKKVNEIEEGE